MRSLALLVLAAAEPNSTVAFATVDLPDRVIGKDGKSNIQVLHLQHLKPPSKIQLFQMEQLTSPIA